MEDGVAGGWEVLGAGAVVRALLDATEDAAAVGLGWFSDTGSALLISEAFGEISVVIASQAESWIGSWEVSSSIAVSSNERLTCTCSGLQSAAIEASCSEMALSPSFGSWSFAFS